MEPGQPDRTDDLFMKLRSRCPQAAQPVNAARQNSVAFVAARAARDDDGNIVTPVRRYSDNDGHDEPQPLLAHRRGSASGTAMRPDRSLG